MDYAYGKRDSCRMSIELPYYPYSEYLKCKYGEKVYKLPVNLPVSCPNRRMGAGCAYCSELGAGFEAMEQIIPVAEQLEQTRIPCAQIHCLFPELYEHVSGIGQICFLYGRSSEALLYCRTCGVHAPRLYFRRISGDSCASRPAVWEEYHD